MRGDPTAAVEAMVADAAAVNSYFLDLVMHLDRHPVHALLPAATGLTRMRLDAARKRTDTLWMLLNRHTEVVLRLRGVRARSHRLTPDDLAAARSVVDAAVPGRSRSLDEVAAEMERVSTLVHEGLDCAARVHARLAASAGRCAAHLDAAAAHGPVLGDPAGSPVRGLRERLLALRVAMQTDPLAHPSGTAVDAPAATALEIDCARAVGPAVELAELRRDAATALAGAGAALRVVEQREREVAVLRTAVAEEVVGMPAGERTAVSATRWASAAPRRGVAGTAVAVQTVTGPAAERDDGSAGLRAALATAQERADAGDRAGFGAAMADVRARTAEAMAAAAAGLDDAARPLRVRAELRHRLDLYRLKSAELGCGADGALDGLRRAASDLLRATPTDLGSAGAAVDAYRRAVNAATDRWSVRS